MEYEQNGNDRAKYGTHLLQDLSKRLGGKSYSTTNLKYYRQFYQYYPELLPVIGAYLIERFGNLNGGVAFLPEQIQQTLSAKLIPAQIGQTPSDELDESPKQQSLIGELGQALIGQTLSDELKMLPGQPEVTGISRDGFAMSLSDGSVKAVPQMNLYMGYYREHYMQPDDNPPVGLLLCTKMLLFRPFSLSSEI